MRMTKDEAVRFYAAFFHGEHNIPKTLKEFGEGWAVTSHQVLSTFDVNNLTRLTFLAHEFCYRVEVSAARNDILRIAIHKRQQEGRFWERHPTLAGAVEQFQQRFIREEVKP